MDPVYHRPFSLSGLEISVVFILTSLILKATSHPFLRVAKIELIKTIQ